MRRLLFLVALALLLASGARAGVWRHASVRPFDIYSDLGDEQVQSILHDLFAASRDFQTVWPIPGAPDSPPVLVVLFADPTEYLKFNPGAGPRNRAWTLPVDDQVICSVNVNMAPVGPATSGIIAYNLQIAYATFYFKQMGERIPPWLNSGLRKLISGMCCADRAIEFPPLATDPTLRLRRKGSEADLQAALQRGEFLTLDQLFAVTRAHRPQFGQGAITDGSHRSFWATQPFGTFVDESYEFAQFCLFGAHARYRPGFIRFAQAASNGPVDEANFKGFFGVDERTMLLELWRYADIAKDQVVEVAPPPLQSADEAGRLRRLAPIETQQFLAHFADLAAKRAGGIQPQAAAQAPVRPDPGA